MGDPHGGDCGRIVAAGTLTFRDEATVECLDTASILRTYRRPRSGETWQTPLKSEIRLVAQINALTGLGDRALRLLESIALDPDVPDPNRLFAVLLTFGCTDSSRWINAAIALLEKCAVRSTLETEAAIEAFCLSSNRRIGDSLLPMLDSQSTTLRAAAVRILGYRRALPENAWQAAMADSEELVVTAALKASMTQYDIESCKRTLLPLLETQNEALLRLALRAGFSLRMRAAYARSVAISRVNPAFADALQCVALFGAARDVPMLVEHSSGQDAVCGIRAAAIHGYLGLIEPLLQIAAESEDETVPHEALRSFSYITGIECAGPQEIAAVRDSWTMKSRGLDARYRYRMGEILSTESLLRQLSVGGWSRSERKQIYFELVAATFSKVPHFSVYDFVSLQRQSLLLVDLWFKENPAEHVAIGTLN